MVDWGLRLRIMEIYPSPSHKQAGIEAAGKISHSGGLDAYLEAVALEDLAEPALERC
jgi:hypothetical protein